MTTTTLQISDQHLTSDDSKSLRSWVVTVCSAGTEGCLFLTGSLIILFTGWKTEIGDCFWTLPIVRDRSGWCWDSQPKQTAEIELLTTPIETILLELKMKPLM